ncbi:MAG: type II secretion system protein GspK [Rudaea sp.]|nr:type II secretion system protein GspK [Rudaea sp.]
MFRLGPRQRGVALILVLWVIALMSVLLGSFALIARTENLESRHLFDTTTARFAAEAGLERAVYELRNPDQLTRWVGDGRPYEFAFDTAQVRVEITDESGKIDINSADATLLQALFVSIGANTDQAAALSDAIQDWRDADDVPLPHGAESAEYKAAGLSYVPRNAPFQTVSEVQQVFGMNYELYSRIEPAITIYSGGGAPNPAYAPLEVLLALPGMTPELAQQLIQARQQIQPGQGAAAALTMPDGTPIVANGGGNTYTVKSRATLANGASTVLDASIRLGGLGAAGRPYTVLRWRDDETSR